MRVAVISDIHSNLPALRAVLDDLEQHRPEAIWCLGDLVGYGAMPDQCTDLVAGRAALAFDLRITKAEASFAEEVREILVVTSEGKMAHDIQPLLRFGIRVIAEDEDGCFLSIVVNCDDSATWTITNGSARDCG